MRKMHLNGRCFTLVAVVTAFMVFAMPILAQQEEFMAGRMAGEQAARASTNGTIWLLVGCLGGIVGIAIAYVVEPNPPATMLLGKSPEYVAAYSDAYKQTAKGVQTSKAWTGCIAGTLAYVLLYALAFAAAESTTSTY